jgi:hypothetical protein
MYIVCKGLLPRTSALCHVDHRVVPQSGVWSVDQEQVWEAGHSHAKERLCPVTQALCKRLACCASDVNVVVRGIQVETCGNKTTA